MRYSFFLTSNFWAEAGCFFVFGNCLPHLFSIRNKSYYASLLCSDSNLQFLYRLPEEHKVFAFAAAW